MEKFRSGSGKETSKCGTAKKTGLAACNSPRFLLKILCAGAVFPPFKIAVKPSSNKCRGCGKQHVPGFLFCQRCGAQLEALADDEYSLKNASPIRLDAGGALRLETAVIALLEDGKKADAIRLYREAMCTSEEQTADAIDTLERQVGFVPVTARSPPGGRCSARRTVTRIVARASAAIRRRLGLTA